MHDVQEDGLYTGTYSAIWHCCSEAAGQSGSTQAASTACNVPREEFPNDEGLDRPRSLYRRRPM